jgi:hypothetical protein
MHSSRFHSHLRLFILGLKLLQLGFLNFLFCFFFHIFSIFHLSIFHIFHIFSYFPSFTYFPIFYFPSFLFSYFLFYFTSYRTYFQGNICTLISIFFFFLTFSLDHSSTLSFFTSIAHISAHIYLCWISGP